jgi:hypothetical protein
MILTAFSHIYVRAESFSVQCLNDAMVGDDVVLQVFVKASAGTLIECRSEFVLVNTTGVKKDHDDIKRCDLCIDIYHVAITTAVAWCCASVPPPIYSGS